MTHLLKNEVCRRLFNLFSEYGTVFVDTAKDLKVKATG
jgi:hypothetical protein